MTVETLDFRSEVLVCETRGEDEQPVLTGYAARFNSLSEPLWGYREKIDPGTFKKTLKESDQVALWNHDTSKPLGRRSNDTLTLREDEKGLAAEIRPNTNTSMGRDVVELVKDKTVHGMSFGFVTVREEYDEKKKVRTLKEVRLMEVSVVTFPAYKSTRVKTRMLALASLVERLEDGDDLTEAELRFLSSQFDTLQQSLPQLAPVNDHPSDPAPVSDHPVIDVAAMRLRLRLAEEFGVYK